MSTVQVYNRDEWIVVSLGGGRPAVTLAPGEWVQSKLHKPEGLGMLVANGDDHIVVLWSREPGKPGIIPSTLVTDCKLEGSVFSARVIVNMPSFTHSIKIEHGEP